MKYVRFVTDLVDPKTHRHLGIIRAADSIRRRFTPEDLDAVVEMLQWFDDFLTIPDKLSCRAISWFKSTTNRYIRRAKCLSEILNRYVTTEMLVATQPGYIVYEDDGQVAAIPGDRMDQIVQSCKVVFKENFTRADAEKIITRYEPTAKLDNYMENRQIGCNVVSFAMVTLSLAASVKLQDDKSVIRVDVISEFKQACSGESACGNC